MKQTLSTRAQSLLWWGCFSLGAAVLAAHFFIIQVANMPMSPLKLHMDRAISHYVSPFFSQRWNFFAPQPIEHDTIVLARVRYHDPRTGGVIVTDWVDITHPLIDAVRKNRLSPLFLVEVCLSNVVNDFENSLGKNKNATYVKNGNTYIKAVLPPSIDPFNVPIMARTALASLEIVYPGRRFDALQIGLMHYEYARFTRRHSPPVAKVVAPMIVIDWQPATWVAPYCCVGERRSHGA